MLPLSPLGIGSLTELMRVAVKLLALPHTFLQSAHMAMAMMVAGKAAVVCTELRAVPLNAVAVTARLVTEKAHVHARAHACVYVHVRVRMLLV